MKGYYNQEAQWKLYFEQCDLTTKGQFTQITMGDDENSKHIFMSKNLTLEELQDLIKLIKDRWTYLHGIMRICRDWIKDCPTPPQHEA